MQAIRILLFLISFPLHSMLHDDYVFQLHLNQIHHIWTNETQTILIYFIRLNDNRLITLTTQRRQDPIAPIQNKPDTQSLPLSPDTAITLARIVPLLYKAELARYQRELRRISIQSDTTSEDVAEGFVIVDR